MNAGCDSSGLDNFIDETTGPLVIHVCDNEFCSLSGKLANRGGADSRRTAGNCEDLVLE
jgi:hypothetical protein